MNKFDKALLFPFQVKLVEYAPDTHSCPKCNSICKRHSKGERMPKEINLEVPIFIHIVVGVYECKAKNCKVKFFRAEPPFILKGAHYTNQAVDTCVASVVEDMMPFSKVPNRVGRDFNLSPSISTIHRWYLKRGEEINLETDYQPWVISSFSGVLCVDGVFDKDWCLLLAVDPIASKTLTFHLGQDEDCTSVKTLFKKIKNMAIEPQVVVTDGKPLYKEIIASSFKKAQHQLCLFHLLKGVTRDVLKVIHNYRRSLPKRPKRMPGRLRKGEIIPPDLRKPILKARYLFVTRRKNLNKEQQQIVRKLCTKHPRLSQIYCFMTDIYNLLDKDSKVSQKKLKEKYKELHTHYSQDKELGMILSKHLNQHKLERVTLFMNYKNLDSTNNACERAARKFRKRQKSHYKLRSKQSIIASFKHELMRQKEEKQRLKSIKLKSKQSVNLLLKKIA
jgi:transposase-like protein